MKTDVRDQLLDDIEELDEDIRLAIENVDNKKAEMERYQSDLAYFYAKRDALKKYLGIPLSSKQSSADA